MRADDVGREFGCQLWQRASHLQLGRGSDSQLTVGSQQRAQTEGRGRTTKLHRPAWAAGFSDVDTDYVSGFRSDDPDQVVHAEHRLVRYHREAFRT
nr:hypothetical protein [Fodinicola feengrottensis]